MIVIVSTRFGYCHRFRADKLECSVDEADGTLTIVGIGPDYDNSTGKYLEATFAVYKKDIWAMWTAFDDVTGDGLQMEGLENDGKAENEESSDGSTVN